MVTSFGGIMLGILGGILLGAGYVFTTGLLLVPYFRLKALWAAGQGLDHLPFMYFLSLLNSITWVGYGFLPPLKLSVLIISVIGVIVQIVYIIWYISICAHPAGKLFIACILIVVLLSCGTTAYFSYGVLVRGGPNSLDTPATITSILMYVGPLGDTATAIYTHDHARMSIPIILVSFGNAVSWGEYGRVQGLEMIRFANELGVISPIIQLVVYFVLRRNEMPAIRQEIGQFFARITGFLSQAYILLRHDENEEDDAQ